MRRLHFASPVLIALLAAIALAGCGGDDLAENQQQVLTYEQQVGKINKLFGRPKADLRRAQAVTRRVLRRYRKLHPPPLLRALHVRVLEALTAALAAQRDGGRALLAGDARAVRGAATDNAHAQEQLNDALARITAVVNKCRLDASACSPS